MKITKSDLEKNNFDITNNYKFDQLFIEYNFAYLKKFKEIEKYTINFKNNIYSFLATLIFSLICTSLVFWIFKTGYKLKH